MTSTINAYERVAAAIREDILADHLQGGDRLPDEGALAERYEVGRSTVREALRLLSGRGWLRSVRGTNGGVFVAQPQPFDLGRELGDDLAFLVRGGGIAFPEVIEARHVHEEAAARLAARRAGPAEVERIRQLATESHDLLDEPEAFNRVNVDFHIAITEAAHNRVLLVWVGAMERVLSEVMSVATGSREGRLRAAKQHSEITEAIAGGNPDAASAAMAGHLEDFEWYYRQVADGVQQKVTQ